MRHYFNDLNGRKIPALTTGEMREVDRLAIEEFGPNLFQMMENAGRSLAIQTIAMLGKSVRGAQILVLAGAGGNGGGGTVAARHLANHGYKVSILFAYPERLNETVQWQRKVFTATSGKEITIDQLDEKNFDLVIDALIGYGLHSSPRGEIASLIGWVNRQEAPVISLDVPSGVNATTGESYGAVIHPQQTLTLALPKIGLLTADTGKIILADIGIPEKVYQNFNFEYRSPFETDYLVELGK